MNKREIGLILAQRMGITQTEAKRLINGMFCVLAEKISSGEPVKISGFGTFLLRPKQRSSFRKRIVFRPGKSLKECVERKEAFEIEAGDSDLNDHNKEMSV